MSRDEFIGRFRHELGGLILDALERRQGPELALFCRHILRQVDVRLGAMYDALQAKPVNGVPAQQKAVTK